VAENEVADSKGTSAGPASESRGRRRSRLKPLIIGVGVILIVLGIALTVYKAIHEGGPFIPTLAPAFLGVIVIIAALFGRKL
jgi:hypothetical protein